MLWKIFFVVRYSLSLKLLVLSLYIHVLGEKRRLDLDFFTGLLEKILADEERRKKNRVRPSLGAKVQQRREKKKPRGTNASSHWSLQCNRNIAVLSPMHSFFHHMSYDIVSRQRERPRRLPQILKILQRKTWLVILQREKKKMRIVWMN